MTKPDPQPELRNGETIRAYLDELARLKAKVQLWPVETPEAPFETTLQSVTPVTFTTTTTHHLVQGQVLCLAFMLDARRFLAQVKTVTSGVFRIPLSIAQGERRSQFRGAFDRTELARVLAVEDRAETLLGGRTLHGKLLDLSQGGLRVALEEVGVLSGPGDELKVGDRFATICVTALPFIPQIHCRGTVAHVARNGPEPHVGFALEGLSEGDLRNIERILTPRYPPTFGEAFPTRKRRIELADRLGTPTPTLVLAKAPEILGRAAAAAQPVAAERTVNSGVLRIRKAGKKILVLSEHAGTPVLAEAFRQDGFKQVVETRTFLEAREAASQSRFDLFLLDIRVGRHWAGDIMETLHGLDLMLDTPVILMVDYRNDGARAMVKALGALCMHERNQPYEDLVPLLYKLLLE